jgi:hypothetical protein
MRVHRHRERDCEPSPNRDHARHANAHLWFAFGKPRGIGHAIHLHARMDGRGMRRRQYLYSHGLHRRHIYLNRNEPRHRLFQLRNSIGCSKRFDPKRYSQLGHHYLHNGNHAGGSHHDFFPGFIRMDGAGCCIGCRDFKWNRECWRYLYLRGCKHGFGLLHNDHRQCACEYNAASDLDRHAGHHYLCRSNHYPVWIPGNGRNLYVDWSGHHIRNQFSFSDGKPGRRLYA